MTETIPLWQTALFWSALFCFFAGMLAMGLLLAAWTALDAFLERRRTPPPPPQDFTPGNGPGRNAHTP